MKKKVGIIVSAVALGIALTFGFTGCAPKPSNEVKTLSLGDGVNLKIGVYSDSQLPYENTYGSLYADHLRETFELFKQQGVELVLFAGDLCENSSDEAYTAHNDIWNEVFGDNAPEKLYIMGNHDYWWPNDYQSKSGKRKKFVKYIGQSPWEHQVINGYHFIACSPSKGAGLEKSEVKWLEKQLEIAYADTQDKPIFVITHHNVPDTVYGSADWSDSALKGVFDKYSNVVSISGHSHNAMLDERSIFQDKFTAVQTQSIAYLEQGADSGKYNPDKDDYATIPPRAEDAPMCYIMKVVENSTVFERWNVMLKVEEKSDMRWELEYPLKKTNFKYTRDLVEPTRTQPRFIDSAVRTEVVTTLKTNNTGLIFKPAVNEVDGVYAYLVMLTRDNGDVYTYRYFGDYYLGEMRDKNEVRLGLPSELPSGMYAAEIWAQDSFGAYSSNSIKSAPFDYRHKEPINK